MCKRKFKTKRNKKGTKCFEHQMRTDWQNESENIRSNWNILHERTIYCYDGDAPHFPALHFTFLDINVCSLKTIMQRAKQHNRSRLRLASAMALPTGNMHRFFVWVRSPSIWSPRMHKWFSGMRHTFEANNIRLVCLFNRKLPNNYGAYDKVCLSFCVRFILILLRFVFYIHVYRLISSHNCRKPKELSWVSNFTTNPCI